MGERAMTKQMGTLLLAIRQDPMLNPNEIPKGATVEILRTVEHEDFYSGKGYVILWHEKCYADVVDTSRVTLL